MSLKGLMWTERQYLSQKWPWNWTFEQKKLIYFSWELFFGKWQQSLEKKMLMIVDEKFNDKMLKKKKKD